MSDAVRTAIIAAIVSIAGTAITAYATISVAAIQQTAKSAATSTAQITAAQTANTAIDQRLQNLEVVAGGFVTAEGQLQRRIGVPLDVEITTDGRYRATFKNALKEPPVVLATSDGGKRGVDMRVISVRDTGFVIEGRSYDTHAIAPAGFNFIVVRAK
jgi:hypothetical protein